MKVYLDELPKSCEECPFCEYFKKDAHGKGKNEVACYFCGFIENVFVGDKLNAKNCKYLNSIADYTKQVRKEVASQVYKILTNESMWKELKSWWLRNGNCEELQNCLNAIVEGVAEEEIIKNFGSDRKFYMMLDQTQGGCYEKRER